MWANLLSGTAKSAALAAAIGFGRGGGDNCKDCRPPCFLCNKLLVGLLFCSTLHVLLACRALALLVTGIWCLKLVCCKYRKVVISRRASTSWLSLELLSRSVHISPSAVKGGWALAVVHGNISHINNVATSPRVVQDQSGCEFEKTQVRASLCCWPQASWVGAIHKYVSVSARGLWG